MVGHNSSRGSQNSRSAKFIGMWFKRGGSPVTMWDQFCIWQTSQRAATTISTEDRKSTSSGESLSASLVASAMGEATMMSDWKKTEYSFTCPLQHRDIKALHAHWHSKYLEYLYALPYSEVQYIAMNKQMTLTIRHLKDVCRFS